MALFRVVVCGDGETAAATVESSSTVELIASGAAEAADRVDAFLVYGDSAPPAWRKPAMPIVRVTGGVGDITDVILPRPPSAELLATILSELLARPKATADTTSAPQLTWRRKTDMILGRSFAIQTILGKLDRLASSTASVLVTGESGTGKELVARALHYCGARRGGPFVAVNCAAIPESLFESELFGHERGAFTGADVARVGAFEAADGGTLFLDEIGELPRTMQSKLLRVLETGEVTRLGGREPRALSVRVVAATNRDLAADVQEGGFRQDLFYRLDVYPIHIPPLRERREDIPVLVQHHLSIIAARQRQPMPRVASAALEKLIGHAWPGNVRELINVLERAMLSGDERFIAADDIGLPAPAADARLRSYREAKNEFEREYFTQLMRVAGGNISLAAKLAQKTRKEIYEALRRVGASASGFRDDEASA